MVDHGNFAYGGVQRSYSYGYLDGDQIPNSTVAVRCPNVECEQVWLQNDIDSSGDIAIGGPRLAEVGNGIVLEPGKSTGWIPIKNLNLIWHKDDAGSNLNYMYIR